MLLCRYAPVGNTLGNAWRVGGDVNNWAGVFNNALQVDRGLAAYAGTHFLSRLREHGGYGHFY